MSVKAAAAPKSSTLLDYLLDRMAITDRVYHDLKHTQPLVESVVDRIEALPTKSKILIVAPNASLPAAALELDYDVCMWHVSEGILTPELVTRAERTGSLDELLSGEACEGCFDAIVLPFVLEATTEHPVAVLSRLRGLLRPNGTLIVASRSAGGASQRLRALSGQGAIRDPFLNPPAPSFSWPQLPERRVFADSDLRGWSAQAGLRVERLAFVIDRHAALPIHALDLPTWLGAKVIQLMRVVFPGLRDCMVAELTPIPQSAWRLRRREELRGERPLVSVAVMHEHHGSLKHLLERLARQSYPCESFEVLVAAPPDLDVPEIAGAWPFSVRRVAVADTSGPGAANALIHAAAGDIVALTDDLALPPRGWVDIAVESLAASGAALTGRVSAHGLSAQPFLALPGFRPIPREQGWFPASNTFYVREAALEAGGFDEHDQTWPEPRLGWENSRAERLRRHGYETRFEPLLFIERRFPFPGPGARRSWMSREFRLAFELPGVISRDPSLRRRLLWRRLFAARRTMYFDLLLAGLALAPVFRQPLWVVLVLPWLIAIRNYVPYWPVSAWGTGIRNLRGMVFRHLVWLTGLTVGSVRAGRVVL